MRHIAFEQLVDRAEGRLPEAERPRIEAHLAECARCAPEAASVQHLIELMRTDDSQDAPAHVVNRAIRLFRTHRLAQGLSPSPRPSIRQRLIATLRFDSAQQPMAFGVRAGRTRTRELLYGMGDNELEVRLEPSEAGWTVTGQVLGSCSGGEVLAQSEADRVMTDLNEVCEFSLPPLRQGVYTLILRLQDVEVEVPGLELRP
jgi:anti-sigma factor RsiW